MFDDLSDEEKAKLQGYTQGLSQPDLKKEALKKYFENLQSNNAKATEIAARGPLEEKTPEELAFEEQHLDPMSRSLMSGGAIGSIAKAGSQVVPAFSKLQQMMQVGHKKFPIQNTAEGLKVKEALQKSGQILPSKYGKVLIKD